MTASSRPNLLVFMTDQQRADSLGCFGNAVARTPNYDALAARGMRFTNAYSQHSACAQSRISMMTGWYPHVAGHRTLDNLLKPWEPNLFSTLRDAGYFVAWAGIRGDTFAEGGTAAATDFFGFRVRPSLDTVAQLHREVFAEDHRLRHTHYVGRVEEGIDFDEAAILTALDLVDGELPEPFALVLTLFAPHPPFAVADPWFSMYDRADMPPPAAIGSGKPAFMEAMRDRSGFDAVTPDDWAEIAATYAGMVARADDQLGRVLAALDRAGVGDRTLVAAWTDHGEYLGDYGLVEKWPSGLDDCLLRNPLVIAGPGVREGGVHEGFVELVDLLPTLCEAAETEPQQVQFGRSLVPVLTGATAPHRDAAFSEGGFRIDEADQNELAARYPYDVKTGLLRDEPALVGRALAVRTEQWTYVHRTCESDELYDRTADPDEIENVVGRPDLANVVGELRTKVLDWLVDTSDVIPLARDPRMDPALVEQFLAPS
jgi:arylsulfatase A-like enzyme